MRRARVVSRVRNGVTGTYANKLIAPLTLPVELKLRPGSVFEMEQRRLRPGRIFWTDHVPINWEPLAA
jgi:hypothetical protein